MTSECGNVSGLHAEPNEDLLITAVAQQGLWASSNAGSSWYALGTGAGSASVTNRIVQVLDDPDHPHTWWEAGIYNGGGVYKTTDSGTTLKQVGNIGHTDSVSVDFKDAQRKTMLAGGHEQPRRLYKSTDSGNNWSDIGASLPDQTFCTFPLIIDSQTYLVGCGGYLSGPKGVYRSTDGGSSWKQASSSGGNGAPLRASDGSIYWLSSDSSGLARSLDDGAHWSVAGGANMNFNGGVEELPDGRIATLSGSTVVVSANHGVDWRAVTPQFPLPLNGFTYSKARKAFFGFRFTCANGSIPVPTRAINRFDFDYTKP
ncbi:MAG: sialidase family protein [Rhizobacter sp.]